MNIVKCLLEENLESFGKPLVMSLFPYEDVLTKEIESWKGFADRLLRGTEKSSWKCYENAKAISAKGQPFPTEPLIMALLFSQHKLIEWLEA